VWRGTLLHVAPSSIQDPPDRGIHPRHPDTRLHTLLDTGMTVLLTRVTVQGTLVQEIQEYRSTRCLVVV